MEWVTENWPFILFAVIFIGMHLTGHGCCGSHGRHGEGEGDDEHACCSRSGSSKKEAGNSCH
jgi:hypothetical protein